VAVSAGYISPEPRIEFFRHMDAANIDLKAFTEGFYKNLCSGKLAPVLETLEYLKHETNVWFEITTLLIPGENDSAAEIQAESAWVIDGRPANATGDAAHGTPNRYECGYSLRLHWECPRSCWAGHPLSHVWSHADRPRRVRRDGVGSIFRWQLCQVWHALPRGV